MTAEYCEVFHCRNEQSCVITTLSCLLPLAGFEVSLIGRFSGVPRGEYTYVRSDLGQTIPATLEGYQGLIVMGGPQSMYEEDRFSYLKAEKELTRQAISINRPVLGVCLGSQIMAEVLGGDVHPGVAFEVGWKSVTLSDEANSEAVLCPLPKVIVPLHWHGDVYDLPPGAKLIGSSEMSPVQGFIWNEICYGLLFHLEITFEQLTAMIDAFPNDVFRGRQTATGIIGEAPNRLAALRECGAEVFRRWARLV